MKNFNIKILIIFCSIFISVTFGQNEKIVKQYIGISKIVTSYYKYEKKFGDYIEILEHKEIEKLNKFGQPLERSRYNSDE